MRMIWSLPLQASPRYARAILVVLSLSAMGCSVLTSRSGPSVPSPYGTGLLRLAEGDFAAAEGAFRESAASCESGREGRRALRFLSLLALDPRNPNSHPDSAALLAVRFLNLPKNTPTEALEAEALYVAALDGGADPGLRPDPSAPGLAPRFESCDEPLPPREALVLPVLDNPRSLLLQDMNAEREALRERNEALQRTIEELQEELERIRGLLRLPDTSVVRLPPRS